MRPFLLSILMMLALWLAPYSARADSLTSALNATVVVQGADDEARFLGSGFVYGPDGLVLTNAHVVQGATVVRLVTRDGREVMARVIARDRRRDIAILKPEQDLGPGLTLSPQAPGAGDEVYAIGAPLGEAHTVTRGIVSSEARQVEPDVPLRLLQHDAAVNPGSSGGPLVDRQGRLLGMNSRIADGSRYYVGLSYAISATDLARLVPLMLAGELAEPPVLGLNLRAVDRRIAGALGMNDVQGVLIDNVAPGSMAWQAGLAPGDVILSVAGHAITQPGDLAFALEAAGEVFAVTLWRKGEEIAVELDRADDAPLSRALAQPVKRVQGYDMDRLGIRLDGARVTRVSINSPGFFAGLSEGDVVLSANGAPVGGAELAALEIDAPLLLLVQRPDGTTAHLMVDPWSKTRAMRPASGNALDPDVILF